MTDRVAQDVAADELQCELRDLLSLAVFGDHVRWVLTGDDTAELAEWLADAIPQWRSWADRVARHLVTMGVAPDGRVRSLVKDIPLNWVPDGWLRGDEARQLVDDRLHTVLGWARDRRSQATDVDVRRLLDALSADLETQLRALEDAARAAGTSTRTPSPGSDSTG